MNSPIGSIDYQALQFPYRKASDHAASAPLHYPVVVVGAGPVGLALSIDLAQRGVSVLLLDNDDRLSTGSRAICFAKRTLEIFDRLGCGQRMVDKGVSWNVGRVYFRDRQIYSFNLLPEAGHERPAFINLQQYYVEGYLVERAAELSSKFGSATLLEPPRGASQAGPALGALGGIDLRWKSAVAGVQPRGEGVRVRVNTPDGPYELDARYLIACDGSKSTVRGLLGLESHGRVFRDRFLIADITMDAADFSAERRFWFDPPFHRGQSVLLHKQADGLWRIDFQLGWDADPERERDPERIKPRVRAVLDSIGAPDVNFEIGWASVYTFACQRLQKFRHGRVLFAGDSAHGVSPFGARGANSGVQDADNLAWKLAAVLQGNAGDALLDSYGAEREYAADENIRHSTRATDFITPKSAVSRLFRDATLDLAQQHQFARSLVNSGRLSVPATLVDSPLNSQDDGSFSGAMVPGAAAADAPIETGGDSGWWLRQLNGSAFAVLLFDAPDASEAADLVSELHAAAQGVAALDVFVATTEVNAPQVAGACRVVDTQGLLARRYDGRSATAYLLRPDQHVCGRWRRPERAQVRAALRRALALN